MSKKSAPPPTGYTAPGQGTPGAFQNATEAEARSNRPTQSTDFGTSSWTSDSAGNWTQNLKANPALQGGLFNLMGQANDATKTPISNGESARTQAYDAVYGRAASRLDPQFDQAENQLQTQLVNQGFTPGTAAYDRAYDQLNRSKTDAYANARRDAEIQSGNAAQQQQQMDVTSQQAPFSTMQLIQSLLQMPGFNQGPQYLNAAMGTSNYNMQNQQMENKGWGDLMGGLFSLGGTLGSAAMLAPALKGLGAVKGAAAPVAAAGG